MNNLESLFSLKGDLLDAWRKKAWEKSIFLTPPASKSDAFSYMALDGWYERLVAPSALLEEKALEILPECKDSYLVFKDGDFLPELSKIPAGVVALPLFLAMKSYGLFLQNQMQRMVKEEGDFFALLNGACHGSGLFLYVPPMTAINKPLQIVHVHTQKRVVFPRIQIVMGKGSSVQIIHKAASQDAICHIDTVLDEGSRLFFYEMSSTNPKTQQMQTVRASLKRDSFFEALFVNEGSKMLRNAFQVQLLEENSEALLRGVNLLSEAHESHVYGKIEHVAPNTRSRQHFKSVLQGQSRASFEGKIFVKPEAQKTEAYQHSQTLILSPEAISYAKPNLEIFADDVKASHGATISQPDKEALFYLRSRGLSLDEASALLIDGFCGEILSAIPFPSIREKFFAKNGIAE